MAGQTTADNLNGFYKKVYADKGPEKVIPQSVKVQKDIKFDNDKKLGADFNVPVLLTNEQGFTYASAATGGTVTAMEAAVGAITKNATVDCTQMAVRAEIDYNAATRATTSEAAFRRVNGLIIESMAESSRKRLEVSCLYGQSGIGIISSSTGTVHTFLTSSWASGAFQGVEGARIEIFTADIATQRGAAQAITSVDLEARTVTTPSIAGVIANDIMVYDTMVTGAGGSWNDFRGIHNILNAPATLFGINTATYSLWKPTSYAVGSTTLTFQKINKAIATAMAKGLDEDLCLYISPQTWADLLDNEVAARRHNSGGVSKYKVGAGAIQFYTQTGTVTIKPSIYVWEGFGYLVAPRVWSRVGATDLTFNLPDKEGTYFERLQNDLGYQIREYSNQSIFCKAPANNIILTGIVNAA